ncbi:MAG: aldo/keto reductase [Bacteroidetes bacterium]|nr:aldo/keto reductase [Bacteroidota bacterium]
MRRKFGETDLVTTPIVYGCMGSSGFFGPQEEIDSLQALRTAYEVGINFFDTAEAYGDGYSEQLLAKALNDVRNDIVISSKAAPDHMRPEEVIAACERSLENLKTDYIDMYLLHWPSREIPFDESIGALKTLQEQGKIRYYGVSNFGINNMNEILDSSSICTNQVAYHLLFRAVEYEVLPKCIENNFPIMCYSSLMQGLLAGKYKNLEEFPENRARTRMFDSRKHTQCRHGENGAEQEGSIALEKIWELVNESGLSMEELAIGWLKAQKGVGGIIVGTRNYQQSRALKKLIDINLSVETIKVLTEITNELKNQLGSNIDMWDHRPN